MTCPVIIRIDQDFYLRIDEAFHEFWINYFLFFLTAGFHFSNIEWNTEVSLRQIRKSMKYRLFIKGQREQEVTQDELKENHLYAIV